MKCTNDDYSQDEVEGPFHDERMVDRNELNVVKISLVVCSGKLRNKSLRFAGSFCMHWDKPQIPNKDKAVTTSFR